MSLRDKAATRIVNDFNRYLDEISRVLVRARKFVPAVMQRTITAEAYESLFDALSAAFMYVEICNGMIQRMKRMEFDEDSITALIQRGMVMYSELVAIDRAAESVAKELGYAE